MFCNSCKPAAHAAQTRGRAGYVFHECCIHLHPGSAHFPCSLLAELTACRAALPLFPLKSASSPSPVFQSACEAVVPCGTANALCCNGVGRLLANNGTAYDGYSIAYNSAAFALFSLNASVRHLHLFGP